MAVLSEKVLWPVLAVFIFGIMAGFYIDDRRKLMQEESGTSNKEHAGKSADKKHAKKEHGGKPASTKMASSGQTSKATQQSSNNNSSHGSTSMSIDEYLAKSTQERSQQLIANVKLHQGFSGSIDEYLSGTSAKPAKMHQNKTVVDGSNSQNKPSHAATSMSMEEYQAKSSGQSSAQSGSQNAYHGGIDGYLAKYGKGQQTPIKNKSSEPFNTQEHMGFHGSYEDYAKKYN